MTGFFKLAHNHLKEFTARGPIVFIICVILTTFVGIVNYATGFEMEFHIFYFIPIAIAAWFVGIGASALFVLLSVTIWLFADILSNHQPSSWLIECWNWVIQGIAFSLVALAMFAIRKAFDQKIELNAHLSEALGKLEELGRNRWIVEQKLIRQNEFLHHVFESLTHPFYVVDPDDYSVIIANSAAIQGELPHDTKCYTLTHHRSEPCSGQEHVCPIKEVKDACKPFTTEHIHYDKDGNGRYVEVHAYPILDREGKVSQVIEYVLDVTHRKQLERELRKSRDEMERRVRERTAELESVNEKLLLVPSRLVAVQENERKRLAADLHDSIGQTLTALKYRIEHIIVILEKRKSRQALQLLHEFVPILQRSIGETRAIYMGLKPTMLSDHGFLAALEWYREELLKLYHDQQHVELETAIKEEDIPEGLKIPMFRIVQEALNNAFKHSKSEWVDVRLDADGGAINLDISDDGIGMDLDYILESRTAKSLGILGMKERTELTGGEFTIRSAPNKGTTVKAVWRNH